MVDWKQYQERVASLFRELGCDVKVDIGIKGVRATHCVDVYVTFSKFGFQQRWIVECKFWKRRVPKEKILALKSIVEDVGADRGILIAEAGYQPGALAAAQSTNITLISLADLKDVAMNELLSLGLAEIRRRAATIKHRIFSLHEVVRKGPGYFEGRFRVGIDGALAAKVAGGASVLDSGAEQALLRKFPVPLKFSEDGSKIIQANTLEEFVASASSILDALESELTMLKSAC